ncbi:MAG: 30S ribosomal protein S20 [Minicystis sp.]
MANHASAVKRNRQRLKKTSRNRAAKSSLRTEVKKARAAMKDASKEAVVLVKAATSSLDRAASKGTIPAKRASRVKGRMARALHKASAAPAA